MVLDQKINVLKGAKNRHFPKGIKSIVFVHKSKFFLFVFFGEIKSENIVF